MLEDTWSGLLACVEDTLVRVWRLEGDAHARLLAASAREGLLFKKVALAQLVRGLMVCRGWGLRELRCPGFQGLDGCWPCLLVWPLD